jgi:hypothetical protein
VPWPRLLDKDKSCPCWLASERDGTWSIVLLGNLYLFYSTNLFSRLLCVHDRPFDSTRLWFHFIHDQESIQDQEVSRTHISHSHNDPVTFQAFLFWSRFLQGSSYYFYRPSLLVSIVLSTEIPILFQQYNFRVRFDDFISQKLSWISRSDLLIILIKSSLSD